MPSVKYALEAGTPKNLEISWERGYKNTTVTLDGHTVGAFTDLKDLKGGREFRLPDGSRLTVNLNQSLAGTELRVLRNGQAVAGAANDPVERWKAGYMMALFLGVFNIALGAIAEFGKVDFLLQLGVGVFSLAFGAALLLLGVIAWKAKSTIAQALAVLLFAADGILGVIFLMQMAGSGSVPSPAGIIVRIFLLIPMVRAVSALNEINGGKLR
ncbi:MAG: hypothetical protein SF029_25690 [bacterium]|nr:hypothetical protein [bacterium]